MIEIDHIEIAKLELQRGDILVLRVPVSWSPEQHKNAFEAVKNAMRQADVNVPVLIGDTDVDFQIIRKEAA